MIITEDELDKHKEAFRKLEAIFLAMADAHGVDANEAREMVDHVAVWQDVEFKVDRVSIEWQGDPDTYAVKMTPTPENDDLRSRRLQALGLGALAGLPDPEKVYGYVETFGEMIDEDPPDGLEISKDLARRVYAELAPGYAGKASRELLNKIDEVLDV